MACSTAIRAQDALPAPDVALHQAGGVAVMARQADGKLLVGGRHVLAGKDFASGAVAIGFLHRQNPDGSVDLSFVPSPEGEVTGLAVGSTHAYVAGSFTSIGGQPIARLAKVSLANGAVVADWNPAPDGDVNALVVGADGYLYVGGAFGTIGGVSGRRVVKLDPATGAAVAAWNPAFPTPLDFVSALAIDGANLYVAGSVMGDAQYFGRLHRVVAATGAVDVAFTPPLAAINNQGGVRLAIDGSGNVFMGGYGNLLNCTCPGSPAGNVESVVLAKLQPATGAADPAWPAIAAPANVIAVEGSAIYVGTAQQVSFGGTGFLGPQQVVKRQASNGAIVWTSPAGTDRGHLTAIVPTPEGVVFGGQMRRTGTSFTPGMARLDSATGAPHGGWLGGAYTEGYAETFLEQAGGKLVIGGTFDLVNLEPHAGLARLNADGSVDGTFSADIGGSSSNARIWRVLALGSHIYVAGFFDSLGGQPIRGLARVDAASGAADVTWAPNPDGAVRRIATDGTDVFAAGTFENIGGLARSAIAKISAANGAAIAAFAPPIPSDSTLSTCGGTFGMAVSGGWVYSGCRRLPSLVRAERFSTTTGALDASWLPNVSAGGSVRDFLVSGGNVYLVGDFTSVGAQAKARVAKVSEANGALDAAWGNAPAASGGLTMTAAFVGSSIYAGGLVTGPAPDFIDVPVMLKLDVATGLHDAAWNPAFSPTSLASLGVSMIASSGSGSRVQFAGGFSSVGGLARSGLAAISTTTPQAPIARQLSSSRSHTLALNASGSVLAWGSDSHGQLGQGRAINRPTPAAVSGLPAIAHISLAQHALAVDVHKQVWSWGENANGQLGPRASTTATRPSRVTGMTSVSKVAAGGTFSLALRMDGTVWGWGSIPGYGSATDVRQLAGLANIVEIAAGTSHALARRSDGVVFAFGDNAQGQLGLGTTGPAQAAVQVLTGADAIAAGDVSSMARVAGQPRFWGRHADLTLVTSPLALNGLGGTAASISISGNRPYAARADGTVHSYDGAGTSWVADIPGFSGIVQVAAGGQGFALGINGSGQLFAGGANSAGQLGQGNTNVFPAAVSVPGMSGTAMVTGGPQTLSVLALKSDGSVWFWGQDSVGQSGDGSVPATSTPSQVAIPATLKAIASGGRGVSLALDNAGYVWGWGRNIGGLLDASLVNRSTPAKIPGVSGIQAIAAEGSYAAFVTNGRSVQITGSLAGASGTGNAPVTLAGFSSIVALAAGETTLYALDIRGKVYAIGANDQGQLGNGTTTPSTIGVAVASLSGVVTRIAAGGARAAAVKSDGTVWTWGAAPLGNGSSSGSLTPVQVPGILDAVDISVGSNGTIVRRSNGSLVAWGDLGLADAASLNALSPYPVAFHEPAAAAQAGRGNSLGFIVGNTGLAWGFGRYGAISTLNASIGDGTYVPRDRPVVLLAAGGAGNIDTNDWFLDLVPASTETVPTASTPKMLGVSQLTGSEGGLSFGAKVKYKSADFGKAVNNYVFALVPPSFFEAVKNAPGTSPEPTLKAKAAKNGGFLLAQLTELGWTDVSGQLLSFSQGVASAAGTSVNILNGIPGPVMSGARFCIGYGEGSGSLLSFAALQAVLELPGVRATASGVPCVVPGVYIAGRDGSRVGTEARFRASVVGIAPRGSVQFHDGERTISEQIPIVEANTAVSTASFSIASLAVGVHSIGTTYYGDSQNTRAWTEVPIRHEVIATPSQVELMGPSSSDERSEVAFRAVVLGDNPGGTVQFKDGGADLGGAVPIVGGLAKIWVSTLALGSHAITAVYGGDAANSGATSNTLTHTVAAVLSTRLELSSSSTVTGSVTTVTIMATVTGNNPTGSVVFHNGPATLGTVALTNGVASLAVTLEGGLHVITARYSGDANNAAVGSAPFIQRVSIEGLGPQNLARLGNISTRMRVLTGDDVMIGGFVIGGGASKTVAIVATGPSLTAYGITSPLANPTLRLVRSSDQAVIASNDNWESAPNAALIQGAGLAPAHPFEAAILMNLAPGAYTAIVEGVGGGTGVAVIGVYEIDGPTVPLINISTRGRVLPGNDVMIGGFIIMGTSSRTVGIVATGPSLGAYGITSPLANPTIRLVRISDQATLATNDDWQSDGSASQLQAAGLAPTNPLESGLYRTLPPGAYTVIIEGVGGGTGVAVIGVYAVN